MKLSIAHLPHSSSLPPKGWGPHYHSLHARGLPLCWLAREATHIQQPYSGYVANCLQPPKISHHNCQRNKSVCPHPNTVNPPSYSGGQNCVNNSNTTILFITMHGILLTCMPICFTELYDLLYFTFKCPRQCACVPYVLLFNMELHPKIPFIPAILHLISIVVTLSCISLYLPCGPHNGQRHYNVSRPYTY